MNQIDISKEISVIHCVAYACHMRQLTRLGHVTLEGMKQHKTEVAKLFDKAKNITFQSVRFSNEFKETISSMISQAHHKYEDHEFIVDRTVFFPNKLDEEISLVDFQI